MKFDVTIIGTGIAGSALAYQLGKKNIRYFICTDREDTMQNNSVLSFGHCRLANKDNIDMIVEKCIDLGDSKEKIEFIYSKTDLVIELLEELGTPFEYRSFGVIPSTKQRGGKVMLERLQRFIPSAMIMTELADFRKEDNDFRVLFNTPEGAFAIRSKYLVLATGGYAGNFNNTEKSHRLFDRVKENKGNIINIESIFTHPFSVNGDGNVLIGATTSKGEFIDEHGNYVFDKATRALIKNDDYHESFASLVKQVETCIAKGSKVYFVDKKNKLEVKPSVHYTSGGIKTNKYGEVEGCKGLYAIGECQADGSTPPGRLPGHPFTAAIVYAKVLAEYFKRKV